MWYYKPTVHNPTYCKLLKYDHSSSLGLYNSHICCLSVSRTHTLVYIPAVYMHAHCPYPSPSHVQTPRHEHWVLFKDADKLVFHSGRSKLLPQINTLMEFRTFITRLAPQSAALQGEGSHVWGRRLPVYISFCIIQVQQISVAGFSQEAGRKRVRRTKSDQCHRLQFMYRESENRVKWSQPEYGWIDF